jgi:hypothetical protein
MKSAGGGAGGGSVCAAAGAVCTVKTDRIESEQKVSSSRAEGRRSTVLIIVHLLVLFLKSRLE